MSNYFLHYVRKNVGMLPKCYILEKTFNWKANVILHLYGTMLSALMEKVFIHFTVTITACSLATHVHFPRCLDSTVVVVRPCIQCNGSGLTGRLYKVKDFPARVGNNEKSALYRMVRGSFCKHVLSEFTPKSLGTSRLPW